MNKRKVIRSSKVARELVQKGFKVVDIAPHKENTDRRRNAID